MQVPRQFPILPIRGNEGGYGDGAGIGEEGCDFGDAADIFFPVGGGEAEVFVEAEADVVAVEAVGGEGVRRGEEGGFEGGGDGGLARGGESGEPDCEAFLGAEEGASGVGEGGVVVGYVCRHCGRKRGKEGRGVG